MNTQQMSQNNSLERKKLLSKYHRMITDLSSYCFSKDQKNEFLKKVINSLELTEEQNKILQQDDIDNFIKIQVTQGKNSEIIERILDSVINKKRKEVLLKYHSIVTDLSSYRFSEDQKNEFLNNAIKLTELTEEQKNFFKQDDIGNFIKMQLFKDENSKIIERILDSVITMLSKKGTIVSKCYTIFLYFSSKDFNQTQQNEFFRNVITLTGLTEEQKQNIFEQNNIFQFIIDKTTIFNPDFHILEKILDQANEIIEKDTLSDEPSEKDEAMLKYQTITDYFSLNSFSEDQKNKFFNNAINSLKLTEEQKKFLQQDDIDNFIKIQVLKGENSEIIERILDSAINKKREELLSKYYSIVTDLSSYRFSKDQKNEFFNNAINLLELTEEQKKILQQDDIDNFIKIQVSQDKNSKIIERILNSVMTMLLKKQKIVSKCYTIFLYFSSKDPNQNQQNEFFKNVITLTGLTEEQKQNIFKQNNIFQFIIDKTTTCNPGFHILEKILDRANEIIEKDTLSDEPSEKDEAMLKYQTITDYFSLNSFSEDQKNEFFKNAINSLKLTEEQKKSIKGNVYDFIQNEMIESKNFEIMDNILNSAYQMIPKDDSKCEYQ